MQRRMRKILLLLSLSIVFFAPVQAFAQEEEATDQLQPIFESTQSAEPQEKPAEQEYVLPYPGLLPDSPLYFLKAARDNIIGFLITDPLKKAEFNLLQADKRLQAGIMLIEDKKKYDVAQTTISKGENYLEEAILKTTDADNQGKETTVFKSTLVRAVKKHKSVLTDLQKSAGKNQKAGIADLVKRVEKYEKDVMQLTPKEKAK